jgi:hypothetical protein
LEHVVTTKTRTVERQRANKDETPAQQTRTEYAVSPEEFIKVWQLSASADEVAKKLKMPKPIVHARASSYRKAGVKLKSMPRAGVRTLDVDKLNQLVSELGNGEQESTGPAPGSTAEVVRNLRRR